jgi:hypothetical protein
MKPIVTKLESGRARVRDTIPEPFASQLTRSGVKFVSVCTHPGIGPKLAVDGRYRCVKCGEAIGRSVKGR